ncbi:MAG: 3',5'-cyclic-nucleotide phosphodiesterase [Methylotenera sp.]|nr:MAG: 3',5'-cyclic-nucleotide phosphodiesterase [Methylotenera sp.]
MQIKILGCSGGIGGDMRTTSLLVDDDVLIDAGTGVGDLSLDALLKIDHIFVTHSHLDHIVSIPLLLDTVMGLRNEPVTVHATLEVINILKQHVFNWLIWPNFNLIPDPAAPFLKYNEICVGSGVQINSKTITAVPANHVIPAVGYQVDSGESSLVFTGDTAGSLAFWHEVNQINNLKVLIIETAFSNAEAELARLSKHLCPATLAIELTNLQSHPDVYITHLKPGEDVTIMQEIASNPSTQHCQALRQQQIFNL